MSAPFKGITLHEGYNTIGVLEVNITSVEQPLVNDFELENTIGASTDLYFSVRLIKEKLPQDYKVVFKSKVVTAETSEITTYANQLGLIQVNTPLFPIAAINVDEDQQPKLVRLNVEGPLTARAQECYIKVYDTVAAEYLYTLITDVCFHQYTTGPRFLSVFNGIDKYYKVDPALSINNNVEAVYLSQKGILHGYRSDTSRWSNISTLTFYKIQFPENLISVADGFYRAPVDAGTITAGNFGVAGPFIENKLIMSNGEPYFVKVNIDVYKKDGPDIIYTHAYESIKQGSLDITPVEIDFEVPAPADETPTIGAIETVSGITFSPEFMSFLTSKGLTTVGKIRKAGPISYINDFPGDDVSPEELRILQGHVDFYSFNNDIVQNQYLIDGGYHSIYKIANTPKHVFLDKVSGPEFPLFKAAQFHEVVTQNQKLVKNLLAGTLTDLQLESPAIPSNRSSSFVAKALSRAVNSCGCDDCKSGISPFAYMMDLMKYASVHVRHNVVPNYSPGYDSLGDFITIISDKFLQPFGTLNVDCETLHDEFCRVRLVTEILEQIVDASSSITPIQVTALANARKQFLLLVYQTILKYAGTSFNELRDVVTTQPSDKKIIAAGKLSNKLGIPLYVPSSSVLTIDRIWLTFGAGGLQELDAVNLEDVFGFRDTKRDVLTETPISRMEEWHDVYMRDTWRKQDYAFTAYSREGADPLDDSTIKSNWSPILDPDIVGREDFTYNTSPEAVAIWQNRKEDIDGFLEYFMTDTAVTSFTAVDIKNRILKVQNRNLLSQTIENNQITILDSSFAWIPFEILNMKLSQTDTDVFLVQSAVQSMFQPYGFPVIRYNRSLDVDLSYISGTANNVVVTWPEDVLFDPAVYARLQSVNGSTVISYETNGHVNKITSIIYDNPHQVTLILNNAGADPAFLSGTITFVYEVEALLAFDTLTDPAKAVTDLYNTRYYNLLLPVPAGMTNPAPYEPWHIWSVITAPSEYEKLKILQQYISAGTATDAMLAVITDDLYMTKAIFSRMMALLGITENYFGAMYTSKRPTNEELYELISIFRNSAKTPLRLDWIKEELKHLDGSSNPLKLMLDGKYFWNAISEPIIGPWDPSLQNTPIIDPERIKFAEILISPAAKPYRDLYITRESALEAKRKEYIDFLIPQATLGFTFILNDINTNSAIIPYSILPYTGPTAFADLLNDLQSTDAFLQKKAADVVLNSFSMSSTDFLEMVEVKNAYENINPALAPTRSDLDKAVGLLLSGYKRMQLYPGTGGWIDTENASSPLGYPVKYYNVFSLKLAPGRSEIATRKEWQKTLVAWNRQPFIQPDLVPPENIKNFTPANWIFIRWNIRNQALINSQNTLAGSFNNTINAGTLFNNLKDQLNLLVARVDTLTPFPIPPLPAPPYEYLPYFTELKDRESNGEDIRPFLIQLGISVTEYRFLANIYDVLKNTPSGAASPLLDSECKDIIDIIIHIRSNNLPFTQVQEEYSNDIILDQDYFQNYKPALSTFPLTDLQEYNPWRSPYSARKLWKDTLETRIDKETNIKDKWQEVLGEAEDRNMPFLRDALIKALTNPCEMWEVAAERIAKTYFIETKDNCCVKHTRVSFALETIQGLLFALQNGIYDGFVSNFTISAPDFEKEWQWLGSYATWRSAVFVFIFPENLLYPTLKRLQSPAFKKLADTIQFSNRFSPQDACDAAKEYQVYFNDLHNLQIICTTTTNTNISIESLNSCCEEDSLLSVCRTYFFAQGVSGKSYWSYKDSNDNSTSAHSFWETLPIEQQNIKLIGCLPLGERDATNTFPKSLSLFLFYTFTDSGTLKMGYIKKDVLKPGSEWKDEQETEDIPAFPLLQFDTLYNVMPCQNGQYWINPCFILSYEDSTNHYIHSSTFYDWKNDKFTTSLINICANGERLPKQALVTYPAPFIVVAFKHTVYARATNNASLYDYANYPNYFAQPYSFPNLVSIILDPSDANKFIIFHRDSFNVMKIDAASIAPSYSNNYGITFKSISVAIEFTFVQNIYSSFREHNALQTFAIEYGSSIGAELSFPQVGPAISSVMANKFSLTIVLGIEKVESADCISDMSARIKNIKTTVVYNMNWPQAPSPISVLITNAAKEVVYEAYYFVPMLLALDQQSRGQFEASLSWYRTVYDYTTNQKVFYGLVLEESILSSYIQASNWLLDPLNPHLIAQTRTNAYTKYTLMNIIQCMYGYADREFTMDTIETVPIARKWYTEALELSKQPALGLSPNACTGISIGCLDTQVDEAAFERYINIYTQLTTKLSAIGDEVIINSLVDNIAELINTGTEETYAENFATAFEMINTATPPEPEHLDVINFMEGQEQRSNDSYRYLRSIESTKLFNQVVANRYSYTVATASGVSLDQIFETTSQAQLEWLQFPTSNNGTPYHFRAVNSSGKQYLPGNLSFNYFDPTLRTFNANMAYSNLRDMAGSLDPTIPIAYVPLIDFDFCIPENPVYKSLQLKGNLELYKIFNCRNIAGMVRELNVFTAETDSTSGVPVIGANGNLVLPGVGTFAPSQYRFRTLIDRAKQIVAQAQQMESLFLSALEKEDAENYSILKARQDLETAKASVKLQNLRINQANDEKVIADLQLGKAVFTQEHYNDLIAAGNNAYEISSLALLQASMIGQLAAAVLSAAAAVANQPTGSSDYGSGALSLIAQALGTQSSIAAQMASFERRSQEWSFQKDLAGLDISISNQQIKVAQDTVRIVTQEREIAQLNTDHAKDSLDFLKNKFTNAELYRFIGNILERSYSYMLNLSTAIAKTAESQLYFERQQQAGPFILDDYWETPTTGSIAGSGDSTNRRGLTGSARLAVDIIRLDQYAFETNKRKLQLTKVISLAQNFPSEFQQFKETGVLNFALTNKMFDYDFPGHYLRLINSVKTTVIGLLPVYDGIKASLTTSNLSYTVIGGTTFQKIPIKRMEFDSVALTSPNNATGTFELQPMQNEFLNPFEGMGVESIWEFKMPKFSNHFDYTNIADVVLTLEYTALDSYQYRYQVLQDLDYSLSFNRGFSMKNNFPDQWYELAEAQSGTPEFGVTFDLKREFFPQGIDNLRLNGSSLILYFARENDFTDEIEVLDFNLTSNTAQLGGETIDGKFTSTIDASGTPVISLRLLFANNFTNRELFSTGQITDILLLVGCKADLRNYPG